ncbi:MAG: anion permease [Desulfuromonas sp.]|nr:anion permease [Desulfuromonas sp.]
MKCNWKRFLPTSVAIVLALLPAPEGLPSHAWFYFAIFAGVIAGLIIENLPGAGVGLIGVTLVMIFSQFVLFSPEQLAKEGFKPAAEAIKWGLSGFSNTTVWLIFAAFMFALGYEKSGLGKRIALQLVKLMGKKTLTLGYAVTIADLIIAPFTPSTTARSGGAISPDIRTLPELYDSKPNDPSARRMGSYLMWMAISATCITSTLFLTGLAPNPLAAELVRKTTNVQISWMQWFSAMAPFGILMLIVLPLIGYVLYPPEVKGGPEVPAWAAKELEKQGPMSKQEKLLGVLVLIALALWIFGGKFIDATTVAVVVVALMVLLRVVTWDDILANKQAWNTLIWFGTLVTLASGLSQVGFVKWFAEAIGHHFEGLSPTMAMILLTLLFYLIHYMFASVTAHVTAVLPVMLAVGSAVPGMDMPQFAMMLCGTLGIMGILTPYATGPSPVYYGSGYLPSKDYWRMGAIFGVIYIAAYLLIGVPWFAMLY